MPDATEHYNLQKAAAAGVQNKWALYDSNFDLIERGRTQKRIAGEVLAQGDLVYRSLIDGKLYKAINSNRPFVGFATEAAVLDAETYIQTEGPFTKTGWTWTTGDLIYPHLSIPGAVTNTKAPDTFQPPVGQALDADTIWINPLGLIIGKDDLGIIKARSIVLNAESAVRPATGGAEYLQVDGANYSEGRLKFDDTTPEKAFWKLAAHPAYAGSDLTIRLRWRSGAITGAVYWEVAWIFFTDAAAWDNALTVVGTVTDGAKGTANQFNEAVITVTSGPSKPTAGYTWVVAVRRVATDAADTLIGDAELVQVLIEYQVEA